MIDDAGEARGGRSTPLWIALVLGTAWLAVETAHAVLENRASGAGDALRRFASAAPWQLGFFGLLALAPILFRRGPAMACGWVVGLATLSLFLARVAEGLLKRENLGGETAVWLLGALGLGLAPVALVTLRRFLPPAARLGFAFAVSTAWVLLFVPALQRGAPTLGFARMPEAGVLFHGPEVAFALAMAACVGIAFAKPRVWALAALLAVAPFARAWLGGPAAPGPEAQGARKPDVILVVVDTLRADHLLDSEHAARTPEIQRFLAESFRFGRAYTPGNRTLVAMPGVMTSLPALSVGQRVSPDAHTFAEHLKDAGYSTVGVSANPLVSRRTGYAQGFDVLSDSFDWPSYQVGDLRRAVGVLLPGLAYRLGVASSEFYYRPGSDVRRRALRLLADAKPPTLLYLHTMDMHGPYLPPRGLLDTNYRDEDFLSYFTFIREPAERLRTPDSALSGQIENLRQRYGGELRFTDAELGLFFAALREQGRYDESLIWLLSDHGESFGERGFAGHGGENTTASVLRVPLAVKLPRSFGLEPRRIETPVSTFDVLPTTLSLLELPPPGLSAGADLSPLIRGLPFDRTIPIVSMGAADGTHLLSFVEGPWQLDLRITDDGRVTERRLYSALDPTQTLEFANQRPQVTMRLERELQGFIRFANRARAQAWEDSFDAQTQEQLRRLGYIE